MLNKPTQNITYTPFLQPDKITEGNYELLYTYAYDHQRRISELKHNGNMVKKIIYQDNYEEITMGAVTYSVHYVYSPDRLVAMVVSYPSALGGRDSMYAVISDHQGSILGLINEQGKRIAYQHFDVWGREMDVKDGTYTISNNVKPAWLIRGYTGHEHLPEFGLITINPRFHHPLLCRMLSPDNFVQDATGTQGYNRYAYVYNNPLKYKDPSGEFFGVDDAIVAGVGFILGAGAYVFTHDVRKFTWSDIGKAALSGLVVAAIAEAGYLTLGGGLVAASSAAGAVGGAGTISGATSFAAAFGMSFGSNVISNREPIQDAYNQGNGWSGFALTAAYAGVASISAGLGNNPGLQKAKWLGENINMAEIFSNTADKGLSTLVQKSYDVESHKWDLTWQDIGQTFIDFGVGFSSAYSGQYIMKISKSFINNNPFMRDPINNSVKNITENLFYLAINKNNSWYNKNSRVEILYDMTYKTFFNFWTDLFFYIEK